MLSGLDIQPIRLPGGELHYCSGFLPPQEADLLLEKLLARRDWHQPQLMIYNRPVNTPRLVAYDGDPGTRHGYSGHLHSCDGWQSEVADLRDRVEKFTGEAFNFALLNLYRDGNDAIGWHRDNETDLGPEPLIASVSIGAERPFFVRAKPQDSSQSIVLEHGSLLLMRGRIRHHLPRRAGIGQPRINISLRQIKSLFEK